MGRLTAVTRNITVEVRGNYAQRASLLTVDDDAVETDETLIPKAKKKNEQEGAEPEPEPEPELDAIP